MTNNKCHGLCRTGLLLIRTVLSAHRVGGVLIEGLGRHGSRATVNSIQRIVIVRFETHRYASLKRVYCRIFQT
jgi:hypothetical protein